MTVDAATRIWRGRESLLLQDLIDEGMWPEKGKKSFDDQAVLLGLRWKPTRGTRFGQKDGTFNRWYIGDIWLDEESIQRAARQQTEEHKTLIRTRWSRSFRQARERTTGSFGANRWSFWPTT